MHIKDIFMFEYIDIKTSPYNCFHGIYNKAYRGGLVSLSSASTTKVYSVTDSALVWSDLVITTPLELTENMLAPPLLAD